MLKKKFFFVGVWVCGLGESEGGGLHGFGKDIIMLNSPHPKD